MRSPRAQRGLSAGFTLIELMVTITVAAILLAVAAPSFVTFQRNSVLTSSTNSLVGALSAARSEALKRGQNVLVVPADGTNWNKGVTVFVDLNNDQVLSTGEPIVFQQASLPSYISATALGSGPDPTYIMFDASGYSRTSNATYQSATLTVARNDVATAQQPDQTRIVVVAKTGRIRSCRPASSTDANCSANALE
jgi:type IV fimbrial biogenesis protein FimT